jgi:myo-inositol-1(or 4)-monophosphatase
MEKSLTGTELHEIYNFALDLGRRAGRILIEGVEKRTGAEDGREERKAEEKMNAVDIVTQTDLGMLYSKRGRGERNEGLITWDLDVEAFVKGEIERRFPGHKCVAHFPS